MNIGFVIKSLRKDAGLSQGDLAVACNLSQTYLSQVEHNKRMPHMNSLQKIAEIFEVPLPILLFLSIDKHDIPEHKQPAFDMLFPAITGALKSLFPATAKLLDKE